MGDRIPSGNKHGKRERSSPESTNTNASKKPNMSSEAKLDHLLKTMEALNNKFQVVEDKMGNMESNIKDEVRGLKELIELKESKWEEEKRELINTQKQLEGRLDYMERSQRPNNAIITGVEATRENVNVVVENLFAKISQPVKPLEISCFKTQSASKIFVRFRNFEDKMRVFKEKRELKYTTADGKMIPAYINDDLSKKMEEMDQEINFHMRKFAKEMRNKKEVKFGFRKLCVDGEWHFWDEDGKNLVRQKTKKPPS